MKGKSIILIVCCIVLGTALCLTSYVAYAADKAKVGYINLQRLVNESNLGKEARKDILKIRKEKETVVAIKIKEINQLKDFINKNGPKMKPEEKNVKVEALKRKYKEYQRLVADAKEDITREDRELVSIILKKADNVLKRAAKDNKFTIILKDPNTIGYLDPSVDITEIVLKALNKK